MSSQGKHANPQAGNMIASTRIAVTKDSLPVKNVLHASQPHHTPAYAASQFLAECRQIAGTAMLILAVTALQAGRQLPCSGGVQGLLGGGRVARVDEHRAAVAAGDAQLVVGKRVELPRLRPLALDGERQLGALAHDVVDLLQQAAHAALHGADGGLERREVHRLAQHGHRVGQLNVGQQLGRGHLAALQLELQPLGGAHLEAGRGGQRGAREGHGERHLVLHRHAQHLDRLRHVAHAHKRQLGQRQDGHELAVGRVHQLPLAVQLVHGVGGAGVGVLGLQLADELVDLRAHLAARSQAALRAVQRVNQGGLDVLDGELKA
mmetsp:Transcript_1193/g.3375  ORF Transcript_1193/g.3375 Transcript_1193/m.3375 type:complete len:321 (-) Transcript_1193:221-1183(-)